MVRSGWALALWSGGRPLPYRKDEEGGGPQPVDLDWWTTIGDETTSNRFLIDDLVLQPGTAVIVRSGASDVEILGQIDAARAIPEGWGSV